MAKNYVVICGMPRGTCSFSLVREPPIPFGVFGEIGLGIRVGDADIDNTNSSAGPQTTDQEVTAVIAGGLRNGGLGWAKVVFFSAGRLKSILGSS